jgi:hypothetical protein
METTMVTTAIVTFGVLFAVALFSTFKAVTWSGVLIRRSDCPPYARLEPRNDKTDPLFCLRISNDEYRLVLQTSFTLKPYVGQRVRVTGHKRWGVLVVEKIQPAGESARKAARPCIVTQHAPDMGHRG